MLGARLGVPQAAIWNARSLAERYPCQRPEDIQRQYTYIRKYTDDVIYAVTHVVSSKISSSHGSQ